jgi:hypothetical protein
LRGDEVSKFEPIRKKPGELLRSEDWNKIQDDIKTDLERLVDENRRLREYVDSMALSVTLTNLDSPVGTSYRLDEDVPGESGNYATSVSGYITRQWILGKEKTGEICRFGILDFFDLLYYWSGAENGDKETLEITLEYVDGTMHTMSNLSIHEWTQLRPKGAGNPYVEYLLSPNERVWYKYAFKNPNPNKEVRSVSFRDTSEESAPRIANVIQHVARIRPI